jgi:hypothetical protein
METWIRSDRAEHAVWPMLIWREERQDLDPILLQQASEIFGGARRRRLAEHGLGIGVLTVDPKAESVKNPALRIIGFRQPRQRRASGADESERRVSPPILFAIGSRRCDEIAGAQDRLKFYDCLGFDLWHGDRE